MMSLYKHFGELFCRQSKILLSRISLQSQPVCRISTIRRALLYVPGNSIKVIENALDATLDCLVMDCEDTVLLNSKDEARESIRNFLDKGPVKQSNPEWCVRINPVNEPELCEADINALLSANNLPASICLPKLNTVDELQWFSEKVWNVLMKRPENDRGPLKLLLLIDTALAIMTLPELCKKAQDLSTMAPFIPEALVLGNDELRKDLGVTRTDSETEIFYAKQKFVVVSKAFGWQAIDSIFKNVRNLEAFEKSCENSVILGFTGRQVVNFEQAVAAQEGYVPTRSRIKWAKEVVYRFNKKQEEGKGPGTYIFFQTFLDTASYRLAENILTVAKSVGKHKDKTE